MNKFYLCKAFNGIGQIIGTDKYPELGIWQSISGGYDTESELREKGNIAPLPCRICGSPFSTNYSEPYKSKLIKLNICFTCNHWKELVESDPKQPRGIVAIVKNVHYMVSPESNCDARFKGHAGNQFKIRFNDGLEVVTTNLWCQGNIPEHFQKLLPNNAEFITTSNTV